MTDDDPARNRALLESLRRKMSVDLIGVADLRGWEAPSGLYSGGQRPLPAAIVLALRLSRAVLGTLVDGPNSLYLHHYRQVNSHLDRAATAISARVERLGHLAMPIPASQIVDWKTMTGQVSHKALAARAGLGWWGRNNLLVTPGLGGQVRLATVLTDMPLIADKPIEGDCGSCRACITACPAGAIGNSPGCFDLASCRARLDEFRRSRGIQQHICGMCVKACAGHSPPEGAGEPWD